MRNICIIPPPDLIGNPCKIIYSLVSTNNQRKLCSAYLNRLVIPYWKHFSIINYTQHHFREKNFICLCKVTATNALRHHLELFITNYLLFYQEVLYEKALFSSV